MGHNLITSDKYSVRGSWNVLYSKDETRDLRKKHIGPSIQTFFVDDPLKIIEGDGQYMFDENKVKYLDCINNVAHVGHSHPSVVSACAQQMAVLNTNSRFLHDNVVHLAKKITETLPDPLKICYFVNSGSEANDLAMRMARYFTGNKDVIVLENAYHGHVMSCIKISPYKFNKVNSLERQPRWVHVVSAPDFYRGRYRDNGFGPGDLGNDALGNQGNGYIDNETRQRLLGLYVADVVRVCENIREAGRKVGAFYLESMQSCGGQIIYPREYWRQVTDIVHSHGGIIIVDEVQTGFGRVGSNFWAFQLDNNDIVPDIITMGKPMGNGYPIAAVVTTRAIGEAFRKGPDYFNTYGGNPVSCAVALAVLEVVETEKLQENAEKIGKYLMDQFNEMKKTIMMIGDVRGAGLFIGVDLVKDRVTREPATAEARSVLYKLKQRHIIMSRDGPYDNVLKIKPPMCFNRTDADFLLTNMREVLQEVDVTIVITAPQ